MTVRRARRGVIDAETSKKEQITVATKTIPVPLAISGLNKDAQPINIVDYSPNLKNMIVKSDKIIKRLGYSRLGGNKMSGIGQEIIEWTDSVGVTHYIALTTTHAYKYNSTLGMWNAITPQTLLENCDDVWVAGSGDTIAVDGDVLVQGTKSVKITLASAAADGDKIAYENITSADISGNDTIGFWFRSDTALAAGDIEMVVSESADGAKTGTYVVVENDIDIAVDTWYMISIPAASFEAAGEADLDDMNAVVSVALYANATIASGAVMYVDAVRAYTIFTGDADNRWSYTTALDATTFSNNNGSALVISNGKDKLHYYEGHSTALFALLGDGDFPYFVFANEVVEFWNHLFKFNYNSGSTPVQSAKSFAYADLAGTTDWLTGTSGDGVLTDSIGSILRAVKLGNELVIYSTGSITRSVYVGGDTLYAFPTVIYDRGLFAANAVGSTNGMQYILGSDNRVYEYQAGHLYSIGDAIEDSLFSVIDASKKSAIAVGVDKANHRVYFFYPTSTDTYASSYYAVDYRRSPRVWEYGIIDNDVRSMCNYYPGTTVSSYMIFLTSDGYVYKMDNSSGKDDAADIECVYETGDINVDKEDNYIRISRLTFNAMSTKTTSTVAVSYSIDSGANWVSIDAAVSISSASANVWDNHILPIDISERKCRFKFVQDSAKDFQVRAIHCDIEIQTPRD